jgi:hypothetical protein
LCGFADAGLEGERMMKTFMRNLTGALFVAAAALGTARPQSAAQEISLSYIRAQQPPESIYASVPCQRAREGTQAGMELFPVYPTKDAEINKGCSSVAIS